MTNVSSPMEWWFLYASVWKTFCSMSFVFAKQNDKTERKKSITVHFDRRYKSIKIDLKEENESRPQNFCSSALHFYQFGCCFFFLLFRRIEAFSLYGVWRKLWTRHICMPQTLSTYVWNKCYNSLKGKFSATITSQTLCDWRCRPLSQRKWVSERTRASDQPITRACVHTQTHALKIHDSDIHT